MHGDRSEVRGRRVHRTLKARPGPKVDADESIALIFDNSDFLGDGKVACARTGGLTLCVDGAVEGTQVTDEAFAAAFDRARDVVRP